MSFPGNIKKTEKTKDCARLTRFISRFAQIEKLVLENFKSTECHEHQYRIFDAVKESLNKVQINKLEVRDHILNSRLQYVVLLVMPKRTRKDGFD